MAKGIIFAVKIAQYDKTAAALRQFLFGFTLRFLPADGFQDARSAEGHDGYDDADDIAGLGGGIRPAHGKDAGGFQSGAVDRNIRIRGIRTDGKGDDQKSGKQQKAEKTDQGFSDHRGQLLSSRCAQVSSG